MTLSFGTFALHQYAQEGPTHSAPALPKVCAAAARRYLGRERNLPRKTAPLVRWGYLVAIPGKRGGCAFGAAPRRKRRLRSIPARIRAALQHLRYVVHRLRLRGARGALLRRRERIDDGAAGAVHASQTRCKLCNRCAPRRIVQRLFQLRSELVSIPERRERSHRVEAFERFVTHEDGVRRFSHLDHQSIVCARRI
jgi:hypothetical protein